MSVTRVERDERTVAIENASYRIGYLLLSYGLLIAVAYRSFALNQTTWDLLALVIAGGIATTSYQGFSNVLTRRWGLLSLAGLAGAVLVAVILVLAR